ncbi:MAG: SSS family solute:Na+ symporter, partial [Verrucomicrobiales bacterium]
MLHEYFTLIDWLVVFGYLGLTTWVGHKMAGSQASIKDFFLGGRSLPWQAVSGSIIATEISGVTFIGVPGMVFALTGNFTYLQWAIGSVLARVIVGYFFVKVYYEKEIYSPYDFMENRLGKGVKRLATLIFSVGSILGQSVRVLVAALALDVVTPWSFAACICVIGVFAIGWTLMGGMRTVIWTDVMQFALFTIGGLMAFFWITGSVEGGLSEFWRIGVGESAAGEYGKFTLWNLTTDPAIQFTLWVAIIAVPFQNLSAFGVDQLNAQRMFCCRSAGDARKAIIWSSVGQLLTLLMLMVGAALFVYYTNNGVSPVEAARFAEDKDTVFPAWITTTLPIGLRGLILAGIFAAAISSLDSILAALSQTTLSLFVKPEDATTDEAHKRLVKWSRILVVFWGIGLSLFAILLHYLRGDINVVSLAFGMVAYTVGPMLGLFLAALLAPSDSSNGLRSSVYGLTVGVLLSFLLVTFVRTEVHTILINRAEDTDKEAKVEQLAGLGGHNVVRPQVSVVDITSADQLAENKWKKVILRGEVTSIDPPEGTGLNAWPLVRFKDSDIRVFVGRPE